MGENRKLWSDQASFRIEKEEKKEKEKNEVKDYINNRYVGSTEALWRLYGYPITAHRPAV